MRRIFAQTRKELTQIVRDWRTLVLALVLPLVSAHTQRHRRFRLTVSRSANHRPGFR